MSYIVPKEIPNCCGRCPCFHAEKLMYCQAVKADKNKRIYAPYGEGRPDWCPLVEVPPHGRLIDADELVRIWTGAKFYGNIKPIVDARPTVIEAEGEK
jgi:hypothetical protein